MIPVTKPFLPPEEDYINFISGIWQRNWLTNNGPLASQLEEKLKDYLEVDNLLYVSNGTIALQLAIKALGLRGKIITTPFSYVATTSSIVWENCEPLFVDIDHATLNIDPDKLESAITEDTVAILATHCFGNSCEIEIIDNLAKKYNLKVIYDAAHAFGSTFRGKSLYAYGDVSTASFHATKLFHTIEGGAVFCSDQLVHESIWYMRNFGHAGPTHFRSLGINGKNSEIHAAMGLAVLPYIDDLLKVRKGQSELYDELLSGAEISKPKITLGCGYNYSYYPVLFRSEGKLLRSLKLLNDREIFPRRYFYPSLTELNYVKKQHCPVASDVAPRILCLPLYHELSATDQEVIAKILKSH